MTALIKNILFKGILILFKFLSSRRLIPLRTNMGNDGNQMTIARVFINSFINANIHTIKGDILEIGRRVYTHLVPQEQVNSYLCLDIEEFPDIDIVADIQNMPNVDSEKFDTIICTQVLEHVRNPFLAVSELHRILKPGGKLILTVPFLNNYHMEPHDYWRYTEYGIKNILKDFTAVQVNNHGSTYHHVLATLGFTASEVDLTVNERTDNTPKFPVIISAVATK